MGLTAKETGSGQGYDPVPAGTHTAVCYAVVDLGTQYQETFNKHAHKVLICWELPDERIEVERDGQMVDLPRAISRKYTMSLHVKAALRHDLEAWRGKSFTDAELDGFDLKKLLGATCLLGVIHKERRDGQGVYATISSIMAPPKPKKGGKAEKIVPVNEMVSFEIDEDAGPGFEIDERLPEWVAKIIQESTEYTGAGQEPQPGREPIQPTVAADEHEQVEAVDDDGLDDIPF
jgi:hypothetical protein